MLRGGAGRKTVSLIFQPTHFIVQYIYYDQYEKYGEKTKIFFFSFLRFHGNGGHLWFQGTHQGTYNIKTVSSNAVKNCTHIEDIQMKKRTEAFLFLLHNTFLIMFCVKNTKKFNKISDIVE